MASRVRFVRTPWSMRLWFSPPLARTRAWWWWCSVFIIFFIVLRNSLLVVRCFHVSSVVFSICKGSICFWRSLNLSACLVRELTRCPVVGSRSYKARTAVAALWLAASWAAFCASVVMRSMGLDCDVLVLRRLVLRCSISSSMKVFSSALFLSKASASVMIRSSRWGSFVRWSFNIFIFFEIGHL